MLSHFTYIKARGTAPMKKILTLIILISVLHPPKSVCQDQLLKNLTRPVAIAGEPVNPTDSLTASPDNKIFASVSPLNDDISEKNTSNTYSVNLKRLTSLFQLDSLKAAQTEELLKTKRLQKLMQQNEKRKMAALMKVDNLDSLKLALRTTVNDTLSALLYTRIALKYMSLDTTANGDKRYYYQNKALDYTLHAIREYSGLNDSTGLRISYTNLAKVYHEQKEYTQAKWFILQSNTLAREQNDTPNIISSLLTLASIKSDIADYSLAMRDLNEALQLSITRHTPNAELEVLKNYAALYNRLKNYKKEALVLKRRDSLLQSIRKAQAEQLAKVAAQKRRLDSLQKKKLYTYALRQSPGSASL